MRTLVLSALVTLVTLVLGACSAPDGPSDGAGVPSPLPTAPGTPAPATSSSSSAAPVSVARQRKLNEGLIAAAWDNDVRRARRLIARGADVNWRDDTVQSAHLIAASEGYLDLATLTLRNGADVAVHDSFDGTGLIRAAERGHWQIVGRLLRTDTERDHVNNLGWTALHEAIILGTGAGDDATTVRVLVAGGVDLDLPSARDGITPVRHAESRGQDVVVRTLSTALTTPTPAEPDAALLRAASSGDADAAAVALRSGARLETRDGRGRTPLLIAAGLDHLEVARVLLALGADPDARDARSDTPWLVTGVTGSVAMADLLLDHHPDLTIRNRFGGLSIIPAAERGHVEYVRRVAASGIDLDHVNDLGWTALLEAVILGDGSAPYVEVVRILLAHGADPDLGDSAGVTPLEHAESRSYGAIARLLRGS